MKKFATKLILGVVVMAAATGAFAANADTEFGGLYNMMVKWSNGLLAKSMALIAFLFGAGVGVAKQSIIPAVMGLVFALMFSVAPGVITGMLTATI